MTATVRNASIIQRLYNWTMEKSAHPHAEYWLALVAFVEASFFPIPPHPLLGLMCLADPKKAVLAAQRQGGGWEILVKQVNLVDCDQNLRNPSIIL